MWICDYCGIDGGESFKIAKNLMHNDKMGQIDIDKKYLQLALEQAKKSKQKFLKVSERKQVVFHAYRCRFE